MIQYRPEIDELYKELCSLYGGELDLIGFTRFMKECQAVRPFPFFVQLKLSII
jgi:hypothetical protein